MKNKIWLPLALIAIVVVGAAVYFGNTATQKGSLGAMSAAPVLTLQKSANSPAGNVSTGSTNVVLGMWDLRSNVDMDITQINYLIYRSAPVNLYGTVTFNLNTSDVYLVGGGAANYVTLDSSNPTAVSVIPPPVNLIKTTHLVAGQTYKLEAVASIPLNAVHNMTYQVSLAVTQATVNGVPTNLSTGFKVANQITVLNISAATPAPFTPSAPPDAKRCALYLEWNDQGALTPNVNAGGQGSTWEEYRSCKSSYPALMTSPYDLNSCSWAQQNMRLSTEYKIVYERCKNAFPFVTTGIPNANACNAIRGKKWQIIDDASKIELNACALMKI
ncbi:hypothetical protein HZA42_02895 [Candidatus Peregrinibacteria bacterium]|nr:hypothetical protein [Candidatus Peregrinibacteria bacterium]